MELKAAAAHLFEVAAAPLLPVHHVVEDGDHDVPQVGLRHQSHLQEGADHRRDEVQLVLACKGGGGGRKRERVGLKSEAQAEANLRSEVVSLPTFKVRRSR